MYYAQNITNNGLGANGEIWNQWGPQTLDLLKTFVQARWGNNTAQQVVQNPNAASNQSYIEAFMQWQMMNNQNTTTQKEDKTLLYVAIAGLGILALMMMNNNNSGRR